MPLYNAEKYLEGTLQSVLEQSFSEFELIISDNGSNDRTQEICRDFAAQDKRIRFYQNETNLGAAINFNRTFHLASGAYFKWIAYDDPIAPTYLEKCVALLQTEPDAVMCYPRTVLIDGEGQVIEYHDDGFDLRSPQPHQRFRQYFHSSAWCHPVFGLVRSSVLRQTVLIGSYPSSDRVLLGDLALRGKCCELPEHLAYRRLHSEISTVAYASDEARYAWFDPNYQGRVMAPRSKRYLELLRVIRSAPLSISQKLLCTAELHRFYLSLGRVEGVLRDMRQIGKSFRS